MGIELTLLSVYRAEGHYVQSLQTAHKQVLEKLTIYSRVSLLPVPILHADPIFFIQKSHLSQKSKIKETKMHNWDSRAKQGSPY